jgi:hypothetical protein
MLGYRVIANVGVAEVRQSPEWENEATSYKPNGLKSPIGEEWRKTSFCFYEYLFCRALPYDLPKGHVPLESHDGKQHAQADSLAVAHRHPCPNLPYPCLP